MTDNYAALAAVYDKLNGELNYAAWADYIDRQIKTYGRIKTSLVLDLCCGTGNMTLELDRRGYDMTGVDLSPEMLRFAAEKTEKAGRAGHILFLCQNMLEFELYGTVQAVVSCLDSLNHIDGAGDFRKILSLVHNYLEPGGVFVFDVNSPYKFKNIYGTNAYVLEADGVFCGWQNVYDAKSRICDFYTTVFTEKADGSYTRRDDYEREYCMTQKEIERLLRAGGFEVAAVHGDIDGSAPVRESERLYFTAIRK